MLENEPDRDTASSAPERQHTTLSHPIDQGAGESKPSSGNDSPAGAADDDRPARRTRRRSTKNAEPVQPTEAAGPDTAPAVPEADGEQPQATGRSRRTRRVAAPVVLFMPPAEQDLVAAAESATGGRNTKRAKAAKASSAEPAESPAQPAGAESEEPAPAAGRVRRRRNRRTEETAEAAAEAVAETESDEEPDELADTDPDGADDDEAGRRRRRRGRRGRGRGKGGAEDGEDDAEELAGDDDSAAETGEGDETADGDGLTRRRRRRRRKGAADAENVPEDPNVVVRIREPRSSRDSARDEVQSVSGSTRLEAKRQRRRDGREQRRTRPPILSEAEFLARREAVDRIMVVRQKNDRTQIAVLEDGVLVEHYVTRAATATMVGNVYLGRVQNVLPSMEAAFVDLGRGRNAVLYAGEVNWHASGLEGRTRTIEQALKSGDSVLVQVTKDPIGTKGARLTSHIALSGRHLVFVPHGNASGISRKLPDVERKRLRDVLKGLVPEGAGVIVRTAAEGASEDELARDVKRLQAQWEDIHAKVGSQSAPTLLYEEPDLVIRVVRDLFNEDFRELIIQGSGAYGMVESYLSHVSPDLVGRVRRHTGTGDVFAEMRIDEQIIKSLDRKVFLPSGGSLVIDRTEAMTVIDVNTGKYTGTGGNLEETVTRNNLEAAEEIVRQLRLRDLGGIVVIDFIDMVLESNRELVLRRLTECLGRDRTKHQVTEITSLGLVQMTRKRVGQGLLEAFSETCEVCKGRGLIIYTEPVPDRRGGEKSSSGKGNGSNSGKSGEAAGGTGGSSGAGGPNGNGKSGEAAGGSGGGGGSAAGNGAAAESGRSGRRKTRKGSGEAPAAVPATAEAGAESATGQVRSRNSRGASGDQPDGAGQPGSAAGGGVLAGPGDPDAVAFAEGAEPVDSGSEPDSGAEDEAGGTSTRRRARRGLRRRTRP